MYWHLRGTCYFPVCKLLPDFMTSHSRRQNSLLSHSEPNHRKHFSELYQLLTWKLLSFELWCHKVHEITTSILQVMCWLHFQGRGMQCNLLKSYNTQWWSWSGQAEWYTAILCTLPLGLTSGLEFTGGYICLLICMVVHPRRKQSASALLLRTFCLT